MKQQVLASQQKPASSARIGMALLLGALTAFAPLSIDMYLPALPELANYFGASTSMAQLSLTACLLGIAVGQLIIGPLSDVFGRKKPLIIGLIVYVIASVLCIVAPSIETFVLLRLVQGLGGAAGIVLSRAIVRDMYEGPEMTKFFALLMLVNGVAPIAAPIAGGQLLQWTSWRGVFLVLGAIGLVMLLASWLGLRETLQEQNRLKGGLQSTLRTFGTLIRDRVFMGYALSQGFVTAAMFAYISGSPFVLQEIFGVSPQMFSLCFAINGLGIIIASQTAGRLAGKVSETKLLIVGLSMASIGGAALLLVILADLGLIAVLIPLFFVVSSVGVIQTASFTLAMQSQGKAAGSASALIGLLSFVIGAIAAPMVGLGGSHTALPMGLVIAASSILAVLFYVFMARRGNAS
ncbi:Bcr/CflA family drug resistance efflux transporter [Paenibacillus sp. BIHB 4019]|uniref:Bcr/CflA family efflux transporter n=1 Tax=Paenibacillus sp. BIHB 4019 TaxID=1870819 RepID=A0A1B2DGG5_9BACL|nr:Bcr/CflA family multidrug efflux MFS transporter [Paenibacillus sp. BIHB 4019]ANY66803.1 Bcr/CflA family drug resistance efflux transporter [Paenibacillus sp. BIHB 4019]